MKRLERNAILAGLRYLQYNLLQIPDRIFDILTDGNAEDDSNHLGVQEINALCESINFDDISFEGSTYGEFEVERVHLQPEPERCSRDTCKRLHNWAVYRRNAETKLAEWLSDHLTEELARTAAAAYKAR